MAFSASVVWEARVTGSDSNGGGFRGGAYLTTPSAPSVSGSGSGGTIAANTYYVVVTLTDFQGETPKSSETSVTTTGTTSSISVTHPTDPSSQGSTWNVYVGTTSGGPYFSQGTGLLFTANRSITSTPPTTGTQAPGIDYSQQDAAQVAYTDLVIGGTNTTATSAGNPFTPAHVGDILNFTGGTGFTVQRAEITGVTAAGVATFEKALGTASSTGGTGNLGGALISPALVSAIAISGNTLFVKYSATPYAMSASTNVASGSISSSQGMMIVGYDTTRRVSNTDANRPTFQASANSTTLATLSFGGSHVIANLILDGNSKTSVTGLSVGNTGDLARNIKVISCNVGITVGSDSVTVENCYATTCATSYATTGRSRFLRCVSVGATAVGVSLGQISAHVEDSIIYNTAGTAINLVNQPGMVTGCTVHTVSGTGTGINLGNSAAVIEDTIIYGCSVTGLSQSTGKVTQQQIKNCAVGNNGTNVSSTIFGDQITNLVTLTGDPCTNVAGGDFSLNTTSGAGAACRGLTVVLPGGTTTSYPDIGAVQHSDGSVVSGPTYSSY